MAEQPRDHTVGLQKHGPEAPEKEGSVTIYDTTFTVCSYKNNSTATGMEVVVSAGLFKWLKIELLSDVDFSIFCDWCVF